MNTSMEAWHFVGSTLRDGRPVPADGELLRHDGELELCDLGLHASERVIDALRFAPGNTICRVKIGGEILRGVDKLCATERTILWRIDAETVLLEFARWATLQVVHLWDCPEVVRKYLETGDPELRAAASAAVSAATRDASGSAARYAAGSAARYAAGSAARYAACHAGCAAARYATRGAEWSAAWHASRYAAWSVAWYSARDAEWDAACDAARDAARTAQNDKLTTMILAEVVR